jgi:hypothetical protein
VGLMAATLAIENALLGLRERGTDWSDGPILSPMDIFKKVGIDWWLEQESKYKSPA